MVPFAGFTIAACSPADEHGQPCRISGISADITDRKRAELDLQNALGEIKKTEGSALRRERRT